MERPSRTAPPLSIVPDAETRTPYLGRVITLELSSGHILELGVAHVTNMFVREADLPKHSVVVYDGLGTQLHRADFESWLGRFTRRQGRHEP